MNWGLMATVTVVTFCVLYFLLEGVLGSWLDRRTRERSVVTEAERLLRS